MLSIDEQKSLIEKFVRANKNFKGNEDLFDDFCSESLQKSYMVFNSISNPQKIESYISKVVHTSILGVLKDYGRVRREKSGYVATKEIKVSDFAKEPSRVQYKEEYPVREEVIISPKQTFTSSFVWDFPDPKESAEEILITKDCLQRIADSVCVIHNELPSQQFYDIFNLRYIKGCKQAEIGKKLGLSQSEVSKRLMRLSKLISNILEVR
ncbi:sigma-70 family RNA polymerase sigma factor [bacterium]|nr:sigma-70 family RNA polymerase sigma factor [bacterium]